MAVLFVRLIFMFVWVVASSLGYRGPSGLAKDKLQEDASRHVDKETALTEFGQFHARIGDIHAIELVEIGIVSVRRKPT
ncbi:MAG: hypothetical protein H0X34_04450 [Chthoniobacterales bacterium]|nr:hypothetical protein [Chthoniobacterales bacterium]